jgi:hypothetical protein
MPGREAADSAAPEGVITLVRRVGSRATAKVLVPGQNGQQHIAVLEGRQAVDLELPDADPRTERPATFVLPDEQADRLPIGALVRLVFEVLPRARRPEPAPPAKRR